MQGGDSHIGAATELVTLRQLHTARAQRGRRRADHSAAVVVAVGGGGSGGGGVEAESVEGLGGLSLL